MESVRPVRKGWWRVDFAHGILGDQQQFRGFSLKMLDKLHGRLRPLTGQWLIFGQHARSALSHGKVAI